MIALIDRVLEDVRASLDVKMFKNLFVMAFQTRWCRGGKAERLLFYKFIVHLYERFPDVVLDLMHFIPRYGYWKDLLSLLFECPTRGYRCGVRCEGRPWFGFRREMPLRVHSRVLNTFLVTVTRP